jgi:hypothetical protein
LSIESGGHNGYTRRCVQNCRNSQPKQIHTVINLKGVTAQYTVTQITRWQRRTCRNVFAWWRGC